MKRDPLHDLLNELTDAMFSDESFRKHTIEKYGVCPKDSNDREAFEKIFETEQFKKDKREFNAGRSFGKRFDKAKDFAKRWKDDPTEVKLEIKVYSNKVTVEAPKLPMEMHTLAVINCIKSALSTIEDTDVQEFAIANVCGELGLLQDDED